MAKKIGIFNHKGGVSKTTTAFHVGWMLARKNKRVVLVDADSQCNLTLFTLGYNGYQNFYEKNSNDNIKVALEPAFKARPKLIEAVNCVQVQRNKKLFVLPGHLDLTEYEVSLGVSFQLSDALGTMKNLPGAFNYLIEKTAEKHNADYVIVDMNPSLSAINQDILVSCDYFMVPASPDYFSFMAIKSLSRVLPNWERWAKRARPIFQDSEYPLPEKTPKFLGYTINDFNLSSGQAQKAFRDTMKKIGNEVINTLIPELEKEGMTLNNTFYKNIINQTKESDYENRYCLAEISNFNKLIAISNKRAIPVFELDPNLLQESQKKTLFWFKDLFKRLADKIIYLTEND